ncbi:unnamed protein product [Periconia digitata]|uniref:Uncharacterized protein n=1 Tax=Periconia digitata TaxID=1303443 RepID=A0A9W4ULW3_9PLEO|nr:unnamed protein product [Periconia digitata]
MPTPSHQSRHAPSTENDSPAKNMAYSYEHSIDSYANAGSLVLRKSGLRALPNNGAPYGSPIPPFRPPGPSPLMLQSSILPPLMTIPYIRHNTSHIQRNSGLLPLIPPRLLLYKGFKCVNHIEQHIKEEPTVMKVYYLPKEHEIHMSSVIHSQKQSNGFFSHPILVVRTVSQYKIVYFYPITGKLGSWANIICLGDKCAMEREDILNLAEGSSSFKYRSVVNLTQCYYIEWAYLMYWRDRVVVDSTQMAKINSKIESLEAKQNRPRYLPLLRDLSRVAPGTVLAKWNRYRTTLSPVLVIQKSANRVSFLRIKALDHSRSKLASVLISEHQGSTTNGALTLLPEENSPGFSHPSVVSDILETAYLREFTTWCYPPIMIQARSMMALYTFLGYGLHGGQKKLQKLG